MLKIILADETDTERSRRWANWIRLIGKGDVDALGALYDESSPIIFGLVVRILEDRRAAEEALLDIYNHVRQHTDKFDPHAQTALDWLIALAHRFSMDRVSRSGLPLRVNGFESDPLRDKRHLATRALEQLPEEQRCVLEMIYLGGLSVVDAADLLQRSREYVARQVVFGMRTLRTFAQELGEPTLRISSTFDSNRLRENHENIRERQIC